MIFSSFWLTRQSTTVQTSWFQTEKLVRVYIKWLLQQKEDELWCQNKNSQETVRNDKAKQNTWNWRRIITYKVNITKKIKNNSNWQWNWTQKLQTSLHKYKSIRKCLVSSWLQVCVDEREDTLWFSREIHIAFNRLHWCTLTFKAVQLEMYYVLSKWLNGNGQSQAQTRLRVVS